MFVRFRGVRVFTVFAAFVVFAAVLGAFAVFAFSWFSQVFAAVVLLIICFNHLCFEPQQSQR